MVTAAPRGIMNIDEEIERLTLEVMQVKLRTAQNEEATSESERRRAEMVELHTIEALAKAARRGGW